MPVVITDLEIKDDTKEKMNKAEEVMMKHSAKKLSNNEATILVKINIFEGAGNSMAGKEKMPKLHSNNFQQITETQDLGTEQKKSEE